MKRVLVLGASGGIGSAVAYLCEQRGATVTRLSRRDYGLDITDQVSIKAALGGLEPGFDLIFVATGALEIAGAAPEKTLSSLTSRVLADQYALNAIGPALVLKHARRLMLRDERAVFAALSARVGSIGDNALGGWYSYRAAKAGLNQLIHTGAIEIARTHRKAVCVTLHPGTVATAFTEKYLGRHPAVSPEDAAENILSVIATLSPEHTGRFFDWSGAEVAW